MSTPPAPPAPPAPTPAPTPTPPAPAPQPAPAPPNGGPTAESVARLEATVAALRQEIKDKDTALNEARKGQMSEAEKAIAAAREEGKAEAAAEHARQLAAAEFRAQSAGRIANPDAALAKLNLDTLVKDGKPDTKEITALVAQLAAVPPPPGKVPPGPRPGGEPTETRDWIRENWSGR